MAESDRRRLAKELVQKIAKKYGYLAEETLQHITNPEARPKNLYSSKTRFIFELLQNADDNQYSKASALGDTPYISFRIYPSRIVIHCNEDGFTHENMKAICAVGESSKTGAQGYIGEKGIGFKSVFMVAWKVHIQSKAFSVSFKHKKGDSGMGMITPVWEETDEVLQSPLTRITLHLLNTETSNGVAETREMIRAQFDELQETVLLFLKNIRKISVFFYGDDGRRTTAVSHLRTQPQPGQVKLSSVYATNGRQREQTKYFHVTRGKATNLAKNDNRTYTEAEDAAKAYSASEVVVAFPLSETLVPIVEPQDVFAFLPVRPAGFNFVIQADFVTNANRQDILKDSRRNIGLLHAVGEAFVTAAIDFQAHETLRYRWVQFLPDRNGSWDGFWLGLVEKIAMLLRFEPVLYDHKSFAPRRVFELLRLLPDCTDEQLLLFKSLGVTTAETKLVRRQILQIYERGTRPEFTIEASKDHLKFLYMTENLALQNRAYEPIAIFNHRGECQRPNQQTMYLANDDPHGAEEVFKPTSPGPNPGDGALGYNVVFVNRGYFEDEPTAPQGQNMSWRAWFSERLAVMTHIDIQIVSSPRFGVHLSYESLYIQLSRPDKFMACVVQWYNHTPSLQLKEGEIRYLQSLTVLCRGGKRKIPLKEAYFPTQRLTERVARFIGEDAFFPWLWLERHEVYEAIPPKWKTLLSKLSVGQPVNDLEFALAILNRFIDAYADSMDPTRISRLFELYQHIHIQYQESDNRVAAAEIISNAFHTRRCIFVPRYKHHKWALPDECVWTAPFDMRTKFALERLYQPWFRANGTNNNSTYLNLFRSMIGIEDCTWAILIDELRELKASKCDDTDHIGTIYKALNALCRDPLVIQDDQSKLIFEDEALIYLPVDSGLSWHRPSECVWSNATKLSGRVSLNEEFEDLEVFFVDFLGVKPLDLSMAIDDLKSVATRASATSSEIKDLIWAVNSLLPTVHKPPSSRDVLKTKIFPIAHPNGRVTVGTATTGFCVIDPTDSKPSPCSSQKELRHTSTALVRKTVETWIPSSLFYGLCLVQGETSFAVEGEKSSLHIDETQSGLKIYVPRDKDHQEYMFTNLLPDKLLDSQVQVANVDEDVALDTASSETAVSVADTRTDNNANGRGGSEAEDAEIRMAFASSSSTNQHAVVSATVNRSMSAQSSAWTSNTPSQGSWTPLSGGSRNDASSQAPYAALLSKVIAAGQKPRANALPLCGAFDLSQLYTDLQPTRDDAELGLRSASQIERDCKIGAAGELYVFELLSHLSDQDVPLPPLPEFSRDNWQSNIRRYVTVHPDYALMEPWSGRETSDIVYEDVSKQLTSLFVRQGYLETRWLSRPRGPKYFIEVKTTTLSCETAFYMSKAQYQRMRNNLVTDDSDTVS
ncbi:hypothetical protein CGCF415_v002550 [Colletotrichum fructicola]|nr:hypothetical protein CGCF415_v002550 [Colletotrichum fructicola]KAF4937609.1 hypothetical protein CGCF245_v005390 [Colletotrichum fructicola]